MSHSVDFVLLESVIDRSALALQCEEENVSIGDASDVAIVEAMLEHFLTIVHHADNDVKKSS